MLTTPPKRGSKRLLSAVTTVNTKKRILNETKDDRGAFHSSDWKLEDACEHLMSVDARFIPVIKEYGQQTFYSKRDSSCYKNHFYELTKIIVFQQLSGSIADKIFNRVLAALWETSVENIVEEKMLGSSLTPDHVLNAKIEIVMIQGKKKVIINGKESGLSESKSKYMVSLAQHFNDPSCLKGVALDTLDDETLERKLVAVKEIPSDRESEADEEEIDIFGKRNKTKGSTPVFHVVNDDESQEEEEIDIFVVNKTKKKKKKKKSNKKKSVGDAVYKENEEKREDVSDLKNRSRDEGKTAATAISVDDMDKNDDDDSMSFVSMKSGSVQKSPKRRKTISPYLSSFLKRVREPSMGLVPTLEPLNDIYLKDFHSERTATKCGDDDDDSTSTSSSRGTANEQDSRVVSFPVDPSRARLKVSGIPSELCNSDSLKNAALDLSVIVYKATPIYQGALDDVSTSAFLEIDNRNNDLENSIISLANGLVREQIVNVEKTDSLVSGFPCDYQVHSLSSSNSSFSFPATVDEDAQHKNGNKKTEIIRIFNLPYDMMATEVEANATRAGLIVVELRMDVNKTTGAPAGAATLKVVENENNASIVEAMIGSKWGGRPIRVEFSSQQPREKKRERRYFDEIPPCSLCGAKDHESYECSSMKCFRCGEVGHMARDCNVILPNAYENRRARSAPPSRQRHSDVNNGRDTNHYRFRDEEFPRDNRRDSLYLAPTYQGGGRSDAFIRTKSRDKDIPNKSLNYNNDDIYSNRNRRWSDEDNRHRRITDRERRTDSRDHRRSRSRSRDRGRNTPRRRDYY